MSDVRYFGVVCDGGTIDCVGAEHCTINDSGALVFGSVSEIWTNVTRDLQSTDAITAITYAAGHWNRVYEHTARPTLDTRPRPDSSF